MEISEAAASNEMWNFVWQTFANASLTYDLVSSQNGTKTNNDDTTFFLENPAKLGIITGFLIACVADFRIATPKFQLDVCLDSKLKTMAITILNLAIFLLLAPIVSSLMAILFVYRKIVELALTLRFKKQFAGLLEGTDCVWALEESTALSVINVLGIFEKNDAQNNEHFLMTFRNLIEKRLLTSDFDKLNWLREKKYGYHYWRRCEKISIEERVRWLVDDDEHEKCDGSCHEINGTFLNDILTRVTNEQLPREHSTSWEILVGRNCTKTSSKSLEKMEEGLVEFGEKYIKQRKTTIPVLFRVHHCLGDGVSLLRLLLESIADSKNETNVHDLRLNDDEKKLRIPCLRKSSSILKIVREEREFLYNENHLLQATMPYTTRIPIRKIVKILLSYVDERSKILKSLIFTDPREVRRKISEYFWNIMQVKFPEKWQNRMCKVSKILSTIIVIPNCLLQQALRSMDNSALHGPALSGKKLLSCWIENDANEPRKPNLLAKIRDIKNATGSRFGDVVLAALSENLHRYFSKIGESAPKTMTVVIPARMTIPSKKLTLQNDFSVGLLTLCCSEINGELSRSSEIHEETRLYERVVDVARSSEKLRNDPDYLINFWVMKWLSALLPEFVLKHVLESHSTMVFSNLPGPQEITINGNRLRNVAFWIPHRGTTGLGCSLLTYGGKIHLSIVADNALIQSQLLLDEIIRNTVDDIERIHESISLSCLKINI